MQSALEPQSVLVKEVGCCDALVRSESHAVGKLVATTGVKRRRIAGSAWEMVLQLLVLVRQMQVPGPETYFFLCILCRDCF